MPGCQKSEFAVFHVDFAQDAKNQFGLVGVFQLDFDQDAKNPRAPTHG
jgi:hypothetical protein